MYTALAFSKDIVSIKQVGQDWRIDLAGAEALVQLATSFISKEQTLFNLPRKDFEETKSEAKASYDLEIPLFDHLRVYLAEKNQWLDVRTQQNHEHFHFVQDCQLDGKEKQSISHQELLNAKTLDFTLSWLPKHN